MRLTSIILAFLLLASAAHAQSLVVVTNIRSALTVSEGVALQNVAGTYRFTFTVEQTAGVPIDLDDGSTFRLEIFNKADRYRVANVTNTTAPEASLSSGKLRFIPSTSLATGAYEVIAWVTPLSGTNDQWKAAWHTLTVTPVVGNTATMSLVPLADMQGYIGLPSLRWAGIYASTGTFDSLIISNLSVAGAISAVDTGAVKIVGSDMTGGLTNRTAAGFVGNGVNLTNLSGVVAVSSLAPLSNAVAQAVTNAGATINGSAISNGAAITVSAAGEVNSRFVSVTWIDNYLSYSAATWYHFWPTNYATAGLGEYDPSNSFSTNTGIYAPGTTGVFMVRCWNDELVGASKTLSIGIYENETLVTNGCGSNAYSPSTGVGGGAVIGYNGDGAFALSGSQWTDNGAFGYFCSTNATNTYKIAFIPWQGAPTLYRGHFTIIRVGNYL